MGRHTERSGFGLGLYLFAVALLGSYFVFASVQGDYGLFQRVAVKAEAESLRRERDRLTAEVEAMRNKTERLSDGYLDLDLLDEQARDILGRVRPDEIVLR